MAANEPELPLLSGAQWRDLARGYPGFALWYQTRVVPGYHTGERELFHLHVDGVAAGIAIAKRTAAERKLCTLWVDPRWRTGGFGAQLLHQALRWLETDKPLFSLPESRLDEFRAILAHGEHRLCARLPDHYRPGEAELVFNGELGGGDGLAATVLPAAD